MTTAVVSLQFGERPYFAVSRRALVTSSRRRARWAKVDAIMAALERHERVLYLDADALPVDPSRPVTELDGMLAGCDMLVGLDSLTHANTGVMLVERSALDVLEHWRRVPEQRPETKQTWPVDELAFNLYTLPAFRSRVALCRGAGTDADLIRGSFAHHYCNGTPAQKTALLTALVATWDPENIAGASA